MTFACPLSLGQESECECVDVKTEAEAPILSSGKRPQCHHARRHRDHARWPGADEGGPHCLRMLSHHLPGGSGCGAGSVQRAGKRPVEKHGKKGNKIIELKEHLPKVEYTTEGDSLHMDLCMPLRRS